LKNKTLMIVESPLQLLAGYEAIKYYNLTSGTVILRLSGNKKNDDQIRYLVDFLDLDLFDTKFVAVRSEDRSLLDYIKFFFFILYLPIIKLFFSTYILGSFKSKFINLLHHGKGLDDRYIIVDDGNVILEIINYKEFSECKVFTSFHHEISKVLNHVEINNFSFVKALALSKVKSHAVIFIGSCIAELDIISDRLYLKMLECIICESKLSGSDIVYIPHRLEHRDKLNIINNLEGIKLLEIDYPIELIGVIGGLVPCKVISFYSSALVTMNIIYQCESIAYEFEYSKSQYAEDISGVYEFMNKYIKVKKLDSIFTD
jgi:hypothetical protein